MTDLKVISDTKGYCVYRDHLPYLGETEGQVNQFQPKDLVTIDLDLELVKNLQDGHGNWTDDMLECLTLTGRVVSLTDNNDVIVVFPTTGRSWTFNPACLTKITNTQNSNLNTNYNNLNAILTSTNDTTATLNSSLFNDFSASGGIDNAGCSQSALHAMNSLPNNSLHLNSSDSVPISTGTNQFNQPSGQQFVVGDLVRIGSNLERIKRLQQHHGEWSEAMIVTLGKIGRIAEIYHDNDLKVEVCGNCWIYNPLAVTKISSNGGFNSGILNLNFFYTFKLF